MKSRIVGKSTRAMLTAAATLMVLSTAAQSATHNLFVQFSANSFFRADNFVGPPIFPGSAPVDPVTGSFTITFDDSVGRNFDWITLMDMLVGIPMRGRILHRDQTNEQRTILKRFRSFHHEHSLDRVAFTNQAIGDRCFDSHTG